MENREDDATSTETDFRYDVYLSFKGETRQGFTGNLYNALRQKRFRTFMYDEGTQNGEQISPSHSKAIEQSRIIIVVFSEKYAYSRSCLEELVKIVECMKTNNKLVWPIFYKVAPDDVRKQKQYYEKAMNIHEKKFGKGSEKVQKWRSALTEAANVSEIKPFGAAGYEYQYIERIVEIVAESLPRYNIFLSFRGKDTRYSFTGFLYDALRREGFKTFMDEVELEGGDQIPSSLIREIERSRLSIVVLSKHFAYSSWCLDELFKILECMKIKNHLVWPIFYKVDPSDVRYQKNSYDEAMTTLEEKHGKNSDKVLKWRSALFEVANLKGWHLETGQYEYECIEKIVKKAIDNDNQLCISSPCSSTE
ncbi:probable disease resistance protein RPP1 [Abrus precatorius]|uniref:Probable disease resistance protein RPP1 n=1 Tax=Abrus precatorius TaxID=3816 RepID=A0A8B8JNX3_ABRPR|nr:probable disease resistance protein RPP1 [Abrus precatorius]